MVCWCEDARCWPTGANPASKALDNANVPAIVLILQVLRPSP